MKSCQHLEESQTFTRFETVFNMKCEMGHKNVLHFIKVNSTMSYFSLRIRSISIKIGYHQSRG